MLRFSSIGLLAGVLMALVLSASLVVADGSCKGGMKSGNGCTMEMKNEQGTADKKVVSVGKEQKLNAPEAKKGDMVICPVMKDTFKVTGKSLFYTYKGKKYYVCCPACIPELKKDPEKYLK
jgi:YHS domain-containing protein